MDGLSYSCDERTIGDLKKQVTDMEKIYIVARS